MTMSAEEFYARLQSEEETGLIADLRPLTEIREPEQVVKATRSPQGYWFGWN
ncbi:MAG: hypothetical protein ABSF61_07430 [Anaerolineales bacterium]|jgi:hypothetical protein